MAFFCSEDGECVGPGTSIDCGGVDSCVGAACGTPCSADLGGQATGYCSDTGECTLGLASPPSCDYVPCAGLACGDTCSPCRPEDEDCVAPAIDMTCDSTGSCVAEFAESWQACGAFDPCEGLACGDTCSLCHPDDTDCVVPPIQLFCDLSGACAASTEDVCDEFDPCEGLTCGDACSTCDPKDPECSEEPVLRFCDMGGTCVELEVECR